VPGSGSVPSREADEARQLLTQILEGAYGSADDAKAAIERALRRANRAEFPATIPEILTFVRAGLVLVLSQDLGPRLTMTVLDEFIEKLEVRSGVGVKEPEKKPAPEPPQSSRLPIGRITTRPRGSTKTSLRVLLVDVDPIGRAALARALLRGSCRVTAIGSLEELGEVVRSGEALDVAVLDDRHPARLLVMETVVDRFPTAAVVVRSAKEAATRGLLDAIGVAKFEVLSAHASSDALLDAIKKAAGRT
jgi:CheY-like chemotaxis protein